MAEITVNIVEFNHMLKQYIAESRLDVGEAVNKKAGDVAFFAARNTKAAKRADIMPYESGMFNAYAASGHTKYGTKVKGEGNARLAKFIRSRRVVAINYSKSLWLNLAQQLGKQVKGLKTASGKAADLGSKYGKADAAKPSSINDKPFAVLTIKGADDDHAKNILRPAMQGAIDDAAADLGKYVLRKMQERLGNVRRGRKAGRD